MHSPTEGELKWRKITCVNWKHLKSRPPSHRKRTILGMEMSPTKGELDGARQISSPSPLHYTVTQAIPTWCTTAVKNIRLSSHTWHHRDGKCYLNEFGVVGFSWIGRLSVPISLPSRHCSQVGTGCKPNSEMPLKEKVRAGRGENLRHSPGSTSI